MLDEWEEPTFDEFRQDKSAWRLFNAATRALKRRACSDLQVTKHSIG